MKNKWTWFNRTFRKNKVNYENAKDAFQQSRSDQQQLLDQKSQEHQQISDEINKLFEQWPQLADNKQFIDQLEKQLNQAGVKLQDIYNRTEKTGGTYLDKLSGSISKSQQELTRSEQTAQTGIDKGLGILRNLTKSGLPGGQAIKDQLSETTANALSTIQKKGGGQGLSALTNIYRQEMENRRNLGITEANYKTQNLQNLAGAETSAGTTMADIISRNAVTNTNLSSTLYGAQSDYLSKLATAETNIASNQINTANTLYGANTENQMNQYLYNQLAPTQAKLNFNMAKYQMTDPFAYQMQYLGENSGFARADMETAINQRNLRNKFLQDILLKGIDLFGGNIKDLFSKDGGGGSGNNMIDLTKNDYWGSPSLINK